MALTKQEVFNIAWKKMIAQGKKSMASGQAKTCVYESQDGSRCAIGIFATDEEIPLMENFPVYALGRRMPQALRGFDSLFLTDLQKAHDETSETFFVEDFKSNMRRLANYYNLQVPNA